MSAAHASAGFAADRIFSVVHQYPWKLAIGDIRAYLEELKGQTDALPESTTSKIWSLLQMGYNREQLCSAVALIKDISWSSTSVEQQHGSSATQAPQQEARDVQELHPHDVEVLQCFRRRQGKGGAREACRFVAGAEAL